MRVKFWGPRGSIPTPGPSTLKYGGNTPCIEIRTDDNTLIILDCGTGLRELGLALKKEKHLNEGHILLSHTHWDHIQGLPAFSPALMKDYRFTIYGAPVGNQELQDILGGQMAYTYFPITLGELAAELKYQKIGEGAFNIGDVQVATRFVNHTVLTLAYRVKAGEATVVYATDHEPYYSTDQESYSLFLREGGPPGGYGIGGTNGVPHEGDRQHIHFLFGADLLIHDAQYTAEEYRSKRNWGHSPADYAVDVAIAANARQLALFHHDPLHDDDAIAAMERHCQERAAEQGSSLLVFAATEKEEIYLPEREERENGLPVPVFVVPMPVEDMQPVASVQHMGQTYVKDERVILIVDDSKDIIDIFRKSLEQDDYIILVAYDGEEGLSKARQYHPDLILLDIMMPKMDGYEVARELKADPSTQDIAIALVTAHPQQTRMKRGFEVGVTDFIIKPIAPAMLRTRVRGLLLRSDTLKE
jgi:CheY-like chemotaxis protein/phosphoribosyl 1,2-cyclic phosphodiesterase